MCFLLDTHMYVNGFREVCSHLEDKWPLVGIVVEGFFFLIGNASEYFKF